MAEQALQAAFEIKTACDEISRRLLRWALGEKPQPQPRRAAPAHGAAAERKPRLYDRLPDLSGKTSWQQRIRPSVCGCAGSRKRGFTPLDLLGDTPHPAAARRACNAHRTARNEAAMPRMPAKGHRRPSSSTRRWKASKRVTRARLSRLLSWNSITGRPRNICAGAVPGRTPRQSPNDAARGMQPTAKTAAPVPRVGRVRRAAPRTGKTAQASRSTQEPAGEQDAPEPPECPEHGAEEPPPQEAGCRAEPRRGDPAAAHRTGGAAGACLWHGASVPLSGSVFENHFRNFSGNCLRKCFRGSIIQLKWISMEEKGRQRRNDHP